MMLMKITAAILFVAFLAFVNLAAAVTASFNRVETSTVASIAGIFGALVDIVTIIVIIALLIRWLMKQAWQFESRPRMPAQQQRRPAAPAQPAALAAWNTAYAPLPFEDHAPAAYTTAAQMEQPQPEAVHIQPAPSVLTDNIRRMRQVRSDYRMVR